MARRHRLGRHDRRRRRGQPVDFQRELARDRGRLDQQYDLRGPAGRIRASRRGGRLQSDLPVRRRAGVLARQRAAGSRRHGAVRIQCPTDRRRGDPGRDSHHRHQRLPDHPPLRRLRAPAVRLRAADEVCGGGGRGRSRPRERLLLRRQFRRVAPLDLRAGRRRAGHRQCHGRGFSLGLQLDRQQRGDQRRDDRRHEVHLRRGRLHGEIQPLPYRRPGDDAPRASNSTGRGSPTGTAPRSWSTRRRGRPARPTSPPPAGRWRWARPAACWPTTPIRTATRWLPNWSPDRPTARWCSDPTAASPTRRRPATPARTRLLTAPTTVGSEAPPPRSR